MGREWVVQRENGRSYLVQEDPETEHADMGDEDWEQLQELAVPGLLPSHYIYRNGKRYCCYDITGKQSLSAYYKEREISFSDCKNMLLSLDRLLCRMYECLLSEERLLFSPDKMYIGMDEKEIFMVYGGAEPEEENEQEKEQGKFSFKIREFAEYLISRVDHKDDSAVILTYQFYKYASAESFNMGEFLQKNRTCLNPAEESVNETILIGEESEEKKQSMEVRSEDIYELYVPKDGTSVGSGQSTGEEKTKRSRLCGKKAAAVILLLFLLLVSLYMRESPRIQLLTVGIAAAYAGGIAAYSYNKYQRQRLSEQREEIKSGDKN